MLKELEDRKFPVECPHCRIDLLLCDSTWLKIFDELDMYGKAVVECANCSKFFLIRDEDEDGPFITK